MMSLNELMDAAHGVSNMYLAHEIAVDKDFMLEKLKPEESEMEIQVKKIVHQVCQKYNGDPNTGCRITRNVPYWTFMIPIF